MPEKIFHLNLENAEGANLCSEVFGSQHFIFNSIVRFQITDEELILTFALEVYQVDEKKGIVRKMSKEIKDAFRFNTFSVCGSGFFAEVRGKKEDRIYLCSPYTDQGSCYYFNPSDFSLYKQSKRELKPLTYSYRLRNLLSTSKVLDRAKLDQRARRPLSMISYHRPGQTGQRAQKALLKGLDRAPACFCGRGSL